MATFLFSFLVFVNVYVAVAEIIICTVILGILWMASSILSTMRSFGHTGCMLLITLLTGLYLSNQTLTEADPLLLLKMMRMVFVIFLLFCILGFFMAKKRKMW